MKNAVKKVSVLAMAVTLFGATTMTAFAGSWQQTGSTWKYQNDDGSSAADGWHWIDGNGDGVSECYYFDTNGIMLSNATTPDGYSVDVNGAWNDLGIVKTKEVGDTKPIQEEEKVSIPTGYNELGLSNLAIDMLEHTREENAAKYVESNVRQIAYSTYVYYNNNNYYAIYDEFSDKPYQVITAQVKGMFNNAPMTGEADSDKDVLRSHGYKAVSDGIMTVVDRDRYELQLDGSSNFAKLYIKFSNK